MGRLIETQDILGRIRLILGRNGPLKGKKIVVTAGGTQEPIDPVRYITNRSSGRQGYAIAEAAVENGAEVTLIYGNVQIPAPQGCKLIKIQTADEMLRHVLIETRDANALVMAAAVADFRPASIAEQKIKKDKGIPELRLENTKDILAEVASQKRNSGYPKITIGFAAETSNLLENAEAKLRSKDMDMIVANDITSVDAGFEVDTNRVTFLFADGRKQEMPLMDKSEVAGEVIEKLTEFFS
jgi:phosphopantothenoylcysteine decarboxylase/phosphopantothenate--cysteine ligase